MVDAQSVNVLVLLFDEDIELAVTDTQFVFSVHLVSVIIPVVDTVSLNVHPPPIQSKVIADASVTPFTDCVLPVVVALYVINPVYVLVIPEVHPERFIDPYIFNADDHAHVTAHTSGHAIVKSAQFAVAVIVTVYAVAFERLLNITLSEDVGTLAHPAPQEEALQFVVVLASQFHVHPTQ